MRIDFGKILLCSIDIERFYSFQMLVLDQDPEDIYGVIKL